MMTDVRRSPKFLPDLWRSCRGFLARRWGDLHRLHARRRAAEVFPWMEHAAVIGAILGAVGGYRPGQAGHSGLSDAIGGAVAGGMGGVLLALGWAATTSAGGLGRTRERRDLWDPWLDATTGAAAGTPEVVEPVAEPATELTRVRPRVSSPEVGESLPLLDQIGPILANHDRGAVRLSGPDGSGKTTALAHLSRMIPPHFQVTVLDQPDPLALAEASARGVVVFASNQGGPSPLANLTLAPWGEDEWIEYLLAGDRDRCASVISRLARHKGESELLDGIPELWSIVLDRMAEDESIEGPRQALRAEFDRRLPDPEHRTLIAGDCLDAFTLRGQSQSRRIACLRRHRPDEPLFRLIRHRIIQLLLGADHIADVLERGADGSTLANPLPRDLLREAAKRIAARPTAIDHLRRLVATPDGAVQPMAASLLHALGVGWRPDRPPPCLRGAYLEEATWAGIALIEADLRGADLTRADLWGAGLDRAHLEDARLVSADLRYASLREGLLRGAELGRARLAMAHAEGADFQSARLEAADLEGTHLDQATLRGADLSGARLVGASLVGTDLTQARIEKADFSHADLSGAVLRGLKLTGGTFEGARFAGADLSGCDLEEMALAHADFSGADLGHALLTGSRMPGANFRGASLRGAGLAEVEWEGADLRGADLREAAFHLGSSRSGLVNSPIACEGSRTGFYTDDFNDQEFKSPEEIRKANLRGADLRGANLADVDFYLVDLRDARLDPEHVDHLRRCSAILESRV